MKGRFDRSQQAKHFAITERDLSIVKAVFTARYLTLEMVGELFFSGRGGSSAKRRLRILFDQRFLDKRQANQNAPDVYYLGIRGVRYIEGLVDEGSLSFLRKEAVRKLRGVSGKAQENPALFLSHELTLSRFYVSAVLESRRESLDLSYRSTRALELMNLGFEPDAFIDVTYVDGEGKRRGKAAFVEFTQVLPKDLKSYVGIRQEYLESGRCRHDFGAGSISVLWFSTSAHKCQQILSAIAVTVDEPAWHLWNVGLWEKVKGSVVTGQVWQQVGYSEEVAFLTVKRS